MTVALQCTCFGKVTFADLNITRVLYVLKLRLNPFKMYYNLYIQKELTFKACILNCYSRYNLIFRKNIQSARIMSKMTVSTH